MIQRLDQFVQPPDLNRFESLELQSNTPIFLGPTDDADNFAFISDAGQVDEKTDSRSKQRLRFRGNEGPSCADVVNMAGLGLITVQHKLDFILENCSRMYTFVAHEIAVFLFSNAALDFQTELDWVTLLYTNIVSSSEDR